MDVTQQAVHFGDLALKIGGSVTTLWGFHVTAMLAAVGWGVTMRTRGPGLGWGIAGLTGALLFVFGLINLHAIDQLYGRMNAALEMARAAWASPLPAPAARLYNNWNFERSTYAVIDALLSVIVALLLSKLGRRPETADPLPA